MPPVYHPPAPDRPVATLTSVARSEDSQRVPASMRRDVRVLGEILGQVISESDGPGLLADVEDLRHRVIAARQHDSHDGDERAAKARPPRRPDRGAGRGWPLERAEAVARAFTVYFHLANLAEEHQRIRTLRERDTGSLPVRESLAARWSASARSSARQQRAALLGRLEVRPVLTAHPTEARRRAVTEALRRIGLQLDRLDSPQLGAAAQAEARRRLREEIDLLWRTSALRIQAMQPLDEVRSGAAVFDETLFRLVPAVYRALDQALQGEPVGHQAEPRAPAFLRFGSWIGGDRDGNPFVTADITRSTAQIQADHALRALENAATRVGRSLTIDAGLAASPATSVGWPDSPAGGEELAAALAAAAQRQPGLIDELRSRSPGEPFRVFMLYAARRLQATRTALTHGRAGAGLAYCRRGGVSCRPAADAARAGGGAGWPAGLRRAAAPDLAGRDLRLPPGRDGSTPAQRGARGGAARAAGR